MALAAFLASLGASITGIASGNETLTVIGTICTTVSAALYAAMEAYVDATRIKNNPDLDIPQQIGFNNNNNK